MTRETQAIFKKALKLPREAKADLVELLLNNILEDNPSALQKIDEAGAKEAKDRFDAFLWGEIQAEPMNKAMEKLRKRHVS